MADHSARLGEMMLPELKKLNPAVVKTARGKGLMNAIEIKNTKGQFGNTENALLLCEKNQAVIKQIQRQFPLKF